MTAYQLYLIFHQDDWSQDAFGLTELPKNYRWKLFIFVAADALISYVYEKVFISWFSKYWNKRKAIKNLRAR